MSKVQAIYQTGVATEHSYRSAIEQLINGLADGITALNEPKRVACGAPDFIVQRGVIAVGHIEAKDLGISLSALKDANKNQQLRYRKALPNLVYTNCLDWQFFVDGKLVSQVSIGQLQQGIQPAPDQYPTLENLLRNFVAQRPQTITSPQVLAELMAGKAALIKDVLRLALEADADQQTPLSGQYKAFKEHLIHDITPADFADLYAETMAYGLFAARLHDPSLETFSRQEALELLPKSNPFLRSLFGYVAGPELDERVRWIVDDLALVFQATNAHKLMQGFGKLTGRKDPFLHFYETFLAAYNPAKRKARGVWYTPEAVVNFIVRAVDEVLQTEFGLADGLADTSKVTIDWDSGQNDKKGKAIIARKEVHRVQVLDPATGTGTFLAEVIKQIAPKVKGVAPGMWSGYIERDLIPRLHGFELLMASYAMCHMKLDMMLTELGYQPSTNPPRLGVYLTNSLEEGERDSRDLFMAQWLTREAREASTIKRQTPIMCVLGNPPYSGESANKGEWIMGLMESYKKEPGGQQKLQERNPKWINDDYVKFLRLAEHMIAKNGEGVLGLITNHGWLDNPTFRGMRWHLLNTFDKLWVLDLHGNSKKKEVAPDGSADKNVFDIQQGVAIVIGVKKKQVNAKAAKPLAQVQHAELWGDRAGKYHALQQLGLQSRDGEKPLWQPLAPLAPQLVLVPRDTQLLAEYQAGFSLHAFMPVNSVGIVTARDALSIDMDKQALWQRVNDFAQLPPEVARAKYALGKDVRDWAVTTAQADVVQHLAPERLLPLTYRPFDNRWTFYTGNSRGFLCYPRGDVMRHMFRGNLGLSLTRTIEGGREFADVMVFNHPITHHTLSIKEVNTLSPLYFYPNEQDLDQTRRVNFDPTLYAKLQTLATDAQRGKPDEVAVFDYLYGTLHRPSYRQRYAPFLKTDFPRIPWPASPAAFWATADAGAQLRRLHLMEPQTVGTAPYPFQGEGSGVVDKPWRDEAGKVWVNATQFFEGVPLVAWHFWVGGYQPAQKWLKDRRARALSFDDVKHYQRVIKVLVETERIMQLLG
jgi:hypothetical protein